MSPVKKMLLFRTAIGLPFGYIGISVAAGCISWWHGYGTYFVYAFLLLTLITIPAVLKNYKSFYLFAALGLLVSMLFDVFGMILLFYPQYNGWNGWNANGTWMKICFNLPSDFSAWTIGLFMVIFIFFAIKKLFEIDYNKMKKEAFKDKMIDKFDNQIFLNKAMSAISSLYFNVKFLAKIEYWLYTIGFIILCIVALPMQGTGSSMVAFGNNPFTAFGFFVGTYLLIWLSYWVAMSSFAQYQLINKIEQELGIKLKPALRIEA